MTKDQNNEGLTLSLKILNTQLYIIKVFSYFIILLAFCLIFGITLIFYSTKFSLNHLQTHQNISLPSKTPYKEAVAYPEFRSSTSINTKKYRKMDDVEVMWRASMAPRRMDSKNSLKRKNPKIAFMFLVKESLSLGALWNRFFKGYEGFYSIYVHCDPSFNSSMAAFETGVFRGTTIPSQGVQWGRFNMVEAELRLLSHALLDVSNQRFVLLSESCIPLFNFSTVYTYLMNSTQSYIESYDYHGASGRGRYSRKLSPTITISQWRKGSQWFEIDRDSAIDLISDHGYFMLFKKACKTNACCADEHYLPTWMNINAGVKSSNRSVTHVDWSRGGCHPAKYMRMHVTVEFLEKLRSGNTCQYNGKNTTTCFMFARKFHPDALGRLLRFAPKVMHF